MKNKRRKKQNFPIFMFTIGLFILLSLVSYMFFFEMKTKLEERYEAEELDRKSIVSIIGRDKVQQNGQSDKRGRDGNKEPEGDMFLSKEADNVLERDILDEDILLEEGIFDDGTHASDLNNYADVSMIEDDSIGAIELLLSDMTLHEKVAQLFIVTPEKLTGYGTVVKAGETTKNALEKNPVGGLIYSTPNLVSQSQVKEMIAASQQYSMDTVGIPLFISVDEEGGDVARCAKTIGTVSFRPMYQYRAQGAFVAEHNAKAIAQDISALGFNLDFAPVADTWSNPGNKVIGQRAYSDDFSECAMLVAAAVKGFHEGGVLCTLKHFPGHGNTNEDSHTGSAYSNKSLAQIKEEELLPFKQGISAGADFVMMSHVTLKSIDDVPASLSHKITTKLLRKEMGFDGVVITDALAMDAVSQNYDSGELVIKAFHAGNDMFLEPENLDEAISAIETAVENGTIKEKQIERSVRRILIMKYKNGLF